MSYGQAGLPKSTWRCSQQAELRTTVDEICRKVGLNDATFYEGKAIATKY